MGVLKRLFSSQKNEQPRLQLDWIALTDLEQLDTITGKSKEKYQAIFKHSTRCGVSSGVLRQFQHQENSDEIDFYLLDLLSFREISDKIAQRFGVLHESPQLIVLKDTEVIAHASHADILQVTLPSV